MLVPLNVVPSPSSVGHICRAWKGFRGQRSACVVLPAVPWCVRSCDFDVLKMVDRMSPSRDSDGSRLRKPMMKLRLHRVQPSPTLNGTEHDSAKGEYMTGGSVIMTLPPERGSRCSPTLFCG